MGGGRWGHAVPPRECCRAVGTELSGTAAGRAGAGKGGEAGAGGVAGIVLSGRCPQLPGLANLPTRPAGNFGLLTVQGLPGAAGGVEVLGLMETPWRQQK